MRSLNASKCVRAPRGAHVVRQTRRRSMSLAVPATEAAACRMRTGRDLRRWRGILIGDSGLTGEWAVVAASARYGADDEEEQHGAGDGDKPRAQLEEAAEAFESDQLGD